MGAGQRIKAWLTSTDSAQGATFSGPAPPQQADGSYQPVSSMIDALVGAGLDTSTREAALQVTAVIKGRNMICTPSTLPLRLIDQNRKTIKSPLFDQFDPSVANVVHLAMTIEDLLFDGIAWWEKIDKDSFGWPKHARRIDSRRVSLQAPNNGYLNRLPSGIDPESAIWVDGKPKDGTNYIRFDSPNPPFLLAARRALKRIILLEEAAAMYADNPGLRDYFTPANGKSAMSEQEVQDALRAWIASRKKRSTGYVPETLEYHTVQSPNPVELQLSQLMQKATLDLANALGVDPEDLGVSTTSRTYQNATDRRQDRINDVLAPFMRAITDRLGMGDVTKRGHRAVFDLDDYMRADPKTRWETHKIAIEMGATDIAEVREAEEWVDRPDLNEPPEPEEPEPVEEAGDEPEEEEATQSVGASKKTPTAEGHMSKTFSKEDEPTMEAGQTFRFEGDEVTFATDSEKRTITGTIVLYGVEANNGWGTFTFDPGSLEWNKAAVTRVKFLRDHDWGQLLGAATTITNHSDKATATFKVARSAGGDEALTMAEDGALDGLSVGIDIQEWTEDKDGNFTVHKAVLNEVSLTPRPAFEDARLTKVNASKNSNNNKTVEGIVPEDKTNTPDAPADMNKAIAEAVAAAFAAKAKADETKADEAKAVALAKTEADAKAAAETKAVELAKTDKDEEKPTVVNPKANATPGASFEVKEASPYTFDAKGRFVQGEHEFSTDIVEMLKAGDTDGTKTDFGKRVMGQIAQGFDVATGDVNELNPAINRPDMYYNPPGARTPLWDFLNKGSLPNGVQPFVLPKFLSDGNLVGNHTEGTEPNSGTFVTQSQTITPTAVSGKVTITRETWDMGGNPAVSNLIWGRMLRRYAEALEQSSADALATLAAAATTVDLGLSTVVDGALAKALNGAIVALNFTDGYDWDAFAVEQGLYTNLANAVDTAGRPIYPVINPSNANGQASSLFQSLNVGGLSAVPAPKLAQTTGADASWLFDSSVVHGYATAPQRLEFAGSSLGNTHAYAPVANVDIALFGYKAFAVIDLAGVRKVTYDNVA